jgi:sugar O-acyltransferase (sialic acid O-acetyltransferase NeuD family)
MKAEALLVWGGGGHGRVVADLVRAAGYALAGYVDRDLARLGDTVEPGGGRVVVAEAEFLLQAQSGQCANGADGVTLAIGDNHAREACLRRVPGLYAPALVHPSAVVSPSARLGRGTVVLPLAAVNAAARLGEAVIVNTAAVVEHDCVLGDAVHVSPGAVLAGGVQVGARSWIGAGAAVAQGIRVGRDAVVGAGAVVIRDVPDGMTVVGNPARPIQRSEGR